MKRMVLFLLSILLLLLSFSACTAKGNLGDSANQPHSIEERKVVNPASANPHVMGLQDANLKYNFDKSAELFFKTYPDTTLISANLTTRNNDHIWDFSATDGTMIYRQELDANTGDVLWDGQMSPPEHLADQLNTISFDYKKVDDFKSIAQEVAKEQTGSVSQIDLVLEGSTLAYYVSVETEDRNFTVPIKKEIE